ncbi:MAG: lysylphosphatidylglycerol synthase transmembrane domain-containing protein [bacterium]|jgi:hypothetical protein
MTKKSLFSFIQFIFFLFLGFFLLWLSIRKFSENEIRQVKNLVFTANLSLVVPCMIVLIVSHYVRALRWKMMFHPLGYTPKTYNVFFSVLAGFFFNLLFPRLGELMKCSLLSRDEKIPVDRLIGTMVAERFIDVICLLIIIILTITTQFDLAGNYAKRIWNSLLNKFYLSPEKWIILLAIFFSFLIIVFLGLKKAKSPIVLKIKELVKGVFQGLSSIRNIKNKSIFIIYTILIWVLYLLSIKIGFFAMRELTEMGWIQSLTILTFGSFAMIATQGGIGAYQLIVQQTLFLYGINEVTGLAFGWLLWSVQTIMMFILGPLSLILLFILNRKDRNDDRQVLA